MKQPNGPAVWAASVVLALSHTGCTSETSPPSLSERSDQALRDPMSYRADFSQSRVTSGGIGTLDKDGLRRDLNRVLNP